MLLRYVVTVYLRLNFGSDCSKRGNIVYIASVHHLGDVCQDSGLAMNEPVENVLLQGSEVIVDILSLAQGEGVVAVGEDDGEQLVLVVEQVAAVEVSDGNLALVPHEVTTNNTLIISLCRPLSSAASLKQC